MRVLDIETGEMEHIIYKFRDSPQRQALNIEQTIIFDTRIIQFVGFTEGVHFTQGEEGDTPELSTLTEISKGCWIEMGRMIGQKSLVNGLAKQEWHK